jgi:glyoxylase-like metal-dependent hydrolase (beta-lactamase superfamily II)
MEAIMKTCSSLVFFLSTLLFLTDTVADEVFPMRAESVAPGVYAVVTPSRELPNRRNRGWNSNSGFVVTNAGVLLFDTGSSEAIGESLRKTITRVTDKPVRWIINSHAHGDHWLGNAAFEASVEEIIATTKVAQAIQISGRTWIDLFNRMTNGATGESRIAPPTRRVDERTEAHFGGIRTVLFPSGDSHSPGDLLLWLPQQGVLMGGDVVYSNRMPSTNNSRIDRWINILEELVALEPKVVIAGHGAVTDVVGLERLRDLLITFREAVAAGIDEGKSDFEMLPDVIAALAPFAKHFPGLEQKVRRDLSHVFLQVEQEMFE